MTRKSKATRPPLEELKGVRYVGSSNARELSKADFKSAGADVDNDLRWDDSNDKFIAVGQLNAAAVDFLVTQEDFKVE